MLLTSQLVGTDRNGREPANLSVGVLDVRIGTRARRPVEAAARR